MRLAPLPLPLLAAALASGGNPLWDGRSCGRSAASDRAHRRLSPLRAGYSRLPSLHGAFATTDHPFVGGLSHKGGRKIGGGG
ncbi:hypothetical protein GW17_00048084 [Ensete ventricosum]|nr:hypothetical protein GW17_00048084 [Ensete ventricosum]RZS05757.1 hypothetical protein BHM03_00036305 [Ensete ventricosum]